MRHLDVVMHMNIVCVIVLGPISLIRFHAPFAIWIAYCFVDECWMNRNSVLCSICNAFCNCKLFDVSYSNKVIWTWTWTWTAEMCWSIRHSILYWNMQYQYINNCSEWNTALCRCSHMSRASGLSGGDRKCRDLLWQIGEYKSSGLNNILIDINIQ